LMFVAHRGHQGFICARDDFLKGRGWESDGGKMK
jgi:hypothetical protein